MLLKDISLESPKCNILLDETLLYLAERYRDEDVLRFWESPISFIVLGRIGKEEDDIRFDQVKKDRVEIVRRSSGGGTVVQGVGCLNYALILSKQRHPQLNDLKESYRFILDKVICALADVNVKADFHPISDLALVEDQKKISGNAQKRGRKYILHHGTILYDFDLKLIDRYLKMPKDVPVYRQGRSHKEFVANAPLSSVNLFKGALQRMFSIRREEKFLTEEEVKYLDDFITR